MGPTQNSGRVIRMEINVGQVDVTEKITMGNTN